MLARHEGQIVFVAGAIPGERARVRIDRIQKQLAFGNVVAVLDPSPDRRAADVDWACGGSLYAHIAYERQRQLKSEVIADAFARIAKMPLAAEVAVRASREEGYRMRARLHARHGKLGFFREGTHDLCDAAPTRQLLPDSIDALRRLEGALHASRSRRASFQRTPPRPSGRCCSNSRRRPAAPNLIDPIDGISGLLFVDHQQGHMTVSYGSPYVCDLIPVSDASVALTHHVQSFFQGNRHLLPELVTQVLAQVPAGTVTELYAGVGLFAVSLAARGNAQVVAVEGDRSSARDLESNAAPYGDRDARPASFG